MTRLIATPSNAKFTDKVTLPQSILDSLLSEYADQLPRPLMFKIGSRALQRHTHVGVREFTAEDGTVGLPEGVYENLGLKDKDSQVLEVTLATVPKATNMTIKPLEEYNVDNYEALLEASMRANYTALTVGDTITIPDPSGGPNLGFLVEKLEPESAVCIVDTDVNLDINHTVRVGSASTSTTPTEVGIGSINVSSPAKFKTSTGTSGISITSSGLVYISDDDSVSKTCFIWSNLSGPVTILKGNPFGDTLFIYAEPGVLSITQNVPESVDLTQDAVVDTSGNSAAHPDSEQCPNCRSYIPSRTFQLHTTFCERNNVPCPKIEVCGKLFKRNNVDEDHWHCSHCDAFGDSKSDQEIHDWFFHTNPEPCACGDTATSNVSQALHRATECPLKLHECRFCHLRVPRERASPVDVMEGYSGHEAQCGGKTADCHICGRPVRLRDMKAHAELHSIKRIEKLTPVICSNDLCVRPIKNATLGLCDICNGPLYSAVNDPTGSRLKSRIERRYVIQLTKGCGKVTCKNKYCVSSGLIGKPTMAEVIPLVQKELMTSFPPFHFCVDEMTTKRRNFVDFQISTQSDYTREWLAAAIEAAKGNETEAVRWLEYNAPKVGEVRG